MTQYWVIRGGERRGPYEESDVLEGVELGTVRPNDLLWVEGMREGLPIAEVIANLGAAPASKPPLTLEPLKPGARSPYRPPAARVDDLAELALGNITYAGFWVRFAAATLDALVILVVALAIGARDRRRRAAARISRAAGERRPVAERARDGDQRGVLRGARVGPAVRDLRQARVPPPGAGCRGPHADQLPARARALGRAVRVDLPADDRLSHAAVHAAQAGAPRLHRRHRGRRAGGVFAYAGRDRDPSRPRRAGDHRRPRRRRALFGR